MINTKGGMSAFLVLIVAVSSPVGAQTMRTCNEANLAKQMQRKNPALSEMKIGVVFGNGSDIPVILDGKQETLPVVVYVRSYDGDDFCLVDPTNLTFEWQYSEKARYQDVGARVVSPAHFSMPLRRGLTYGLSLIVNHPTLGSESVALFQPITIWTAEQAQLNELMNVLNSIRQPSYDPLVAPSPPEIAAIGKIRSRAIDALDKDKFDEALQFVQEVRDRIEALPGGTKWKPALDLTDEIVVAISARRMGTNQW